MVLLGVRIIGLGLVLGFGLRSGLRVVNVSS